MNDGVFFELLQESNPDLYLQIENQAFLNLANRGIIPPIREQENYDRQIMTEMKLILMGLPVVHQNNNYYPAY